MNHTEEFLRAIGKVCHDVSEISIESLVVHLANLRERSGRLFVLGIGGSAANASHAVNDFRKLCNIEAYCPTDNIAELTACTNDLGWDWFFSEWLKESELCSADALLILSVGGGDVQLKVSMGLAKAIDYARDRRSQVYGIVGRDSGYTATHGDLVIVIPQVRDGWITPIVESMQSVLLHCLVSHPKLQLRKTKW